MSYGISELHLLVWFIPVYFIVWRISWNYDTLENTRLTTGKHNIGGTCFGIMSSILPRTNVSIKSLHLYYIRAEVSYFKCNCLFSYSQVFNMQICYQNIIHFLKIMRSWVQNKYHQYYSKLAWHGMPRPVKIVIDLKRWLSNAAACNSCFLAPFSKVSGSATESNNIIWG